jgi:hypothetical protein
MYTWTVLFVSIIHKTLAYKFAIHLYLRIIYRIKHNNISNDEADMQPNTTAQNTK